MTITIKNESSTRLSPESPNEQSQGKSARSWSFVAIALYSVLGYYSHNIGEAIPQDVLMLSGIVLSMALGIYALFFVVVRDQCKAGLLSFATLLILLFYGHAAAALQFLLSYRIPHRVLIPSLFVLIYGMVHLMTRSSVRLRNATIILNTFSGALLLVPLISVAGHEATLFLSRNTAPKSDVGLTSTLKTPHAPPDVFFIILDRYAANRTLLDKYGFDNSKFTDYLRNKGFHVAEHSIANYIRTAYSLASTFDMNYLDDLAQRMGTGSSNFRPTVRMLKVEHRVLKAFRSMGYRYVHLGSWWDPTRSHGFADEVINTRGSVAMSEALSTYLRGTVFYAALPFLEQALGVRWMRDLGLKSRWDEQCERVPYQFERMKEITENDKPSFVFAHILLPHYPFVFDSSGQCMSFEESEKLGSRQQYLEQIQYANKELVGLVNSLLTRDNPPIILIQADEGPFPIHYANENKIDWTKASEEDLQEKFRILNAAYFPGKQSSQRYDSISSVNTFRVVFNEFFGGNFPLLPDRSYAIPDLQHLYDFYEVTEAVK
jgi:hypothetical protein